MKNIHITSSKSSSHFCQQLILFWWFFFLFWFHTKWKAFMPLNRVLKIWTRFCFIVQTWNKGCKLHLWLIYNEISFHRWILNYRVQNDNAYRRSESNKKEERRRYRKKEIVKRETWFVSNAAPEYRQTDKIW